MRNWLVWRNVYRRWRLKNSRLFLLVLTLVGLSLSSCSREVRDFALEIEVSELVCDDGLRIFEGRILELAGIKSMTANIESQKVNIIYHENQLSAQDIKTHLLEFGFTIDGSAGNQVARKRLPSCCFE